MPDSSFLDAHTTLSETGSSRIDQAYYIGINEPIEGPFLFDQHLRAS